MTEPRELRIGNLVRCKNLSASGGDYVVAEFVTVRSYVLHDGAQHAVDTPGAMLQAVAKPTRLTRVRLKSIHLHGKPRERGSGGGSRFLVQSRRSGGYV